MWIRRAVAAALSAAVVIGTSGCDAFGVRKGMPAMDESLKKFNTALNNLDCNGIRILTDWNEDDFDYTNIEDLLDVNYYGDITGEGFVSCAEYIASTIRMEYDITTLESYYYNVTVKVKYELVDWTKIYSETYDSFDDVLNELKDSEDTLTIESKIVFDYVDDEWKLCQIYDLNEVLRFIHTLPETARNSGGAEGLSPFDEAIDAYINSLVLKRSAIEEVENTFGVETCGVYDIDGDGIPEIYYIIEEEAENGGRLCICNYPESTGEPAEAVVLSLILYEGRTNSDYSVFVTDKELVIMRGYNDGDVFFYEAMIYDLEFNLICRYYLTQNYDYDPIKDTKTLTGKYGMNDRDDVSIDMTKEDVLKAVTDYSGRAEIMLLDHFTPFGGIQFESVPGNDVMNCYDVIMYLKSLLK